LIKDFLTKNNVTTLAQPPYSPYLVSANVYMFSSVKSALEGRILLLLTSSRMRRRSWTGSRKMASRIISEIFTIVGRNLWLQMGNILKEMWLK
jgi:hypothetical protein